jgi:hypothetical protein
LKAAAAEVMEVETKEGSKASGEDLVNLSRMALQLMEKVLI